MAVRLDILPVRMEQSRLIVVMAEPQNVATIDELRFTRGKDISPRFGFRAEILSAIVRNYEHIVSTAPARQPANGRIPETVHRDGIHLDQFPPGQSRGHPGNPGGTQPEEGRPRSAWCRKSSKRPWPSRPATSTSSRRPHCTVVRIRVDGVLRELESVPRTLQNSLVSRIKILSDMDIGERRAPQDGRFMVAVGQRRVDMRVSTLPTQYGEKVVMRLLEASAPDLELCRPGISAGHRRAAATADRQPQGMLLVTGPTGSGKSTTLYSALNLLRKPAVNIVTVEDPVEYALPGNQPGAREYARRTDVCELPALDPAAGPQRHHDRGNPRSRDRRNRHEGRADRAHGPFHAAHQRQYFGGGPLARSGHSGIL